MYTIYCLFALLALPTVAHAYIDPGTGSLILQMLIAGFLGAAYAIKRHWLIIRAYFTQLFSRSKPVLPDAEQKNDKGAD